MVLYQLPTMIYKTHSYKGTQNNFIKNCFGFFAVKMCFRTTNTKILIRNRLPREVVNVLSLETFKIRLDGALRNLIQLKMSLLTAGWLD